MIRVAYTCPFVPHEWIAAHACEPVRLTPGANGAPAQAPFAGVCPFVRAFAGAVQRCQPDAVVVSTVCDQMRRAAELIPLVTDAPVLCLNVPHTVSDEAQAYYRSELVRLGSFLCGIGGIAPTAERLVKAIDQRRAQSVTQTTASPSGRAPLALVGGPSLREEEPVERLIEHAGGYIALDATESGERGLPGPIDTATQDPLTAIANSYFAHIADPFRRPNNHFYAWLNRRIAETGARGIVLRRYLWCDNWHGELQTLREMTGLPLVTLEADERGLDRSRAITRITALVETLL